MAILAQRIFNELAIHNHYSLTTDGFREWKLKAPDTHIYWSLVDVHNFTMLAITLCKVIEFHAKFRRHLPHHLLAVFDSINSRLVTAGIQDFRNKFSGHLLDRNTGQPLRQEELESYMSRLLGERVPTL